MKGNRKGKGVNYILESDTKKELALKGALNMYRNIMARGGSDTEGAVQRVVKAFSITPDELQHALNGTTPIEENYKVQYGNVQDRPNKEPYIHIDGNEVIGGKKLKSHAAAIKVNVTTRGRVAYINDPTLSDEEKLEILLRMAEKLNGDVLTSNDRRNKNAAIQSKRSAKENNKLNKKAKAYLNKVTQGTLTIDQLKEFLGGMSEAVESLRLVAGDASSAFGRVREELKRFSGNLTDESVQKACREYIDALTSWKLDGAQFKYSGGNMSLILLQSMGTGATEFGARDYWASRNYKPRDITNEYIYIWAPISDHNTRKDALNDYLSDDPTGKSAGVEVLKGVIDKANSKSSGKQVSVDDFKDGDRFNIPDEWAVRVDVHVSQAGLYDDRVERNGYRAIKIFSNLQVEPMEGKVPVDNPDIISKFKPSGEGKEFIKSLGKHLESALSLLGYEVEEVDGNGLTRPHDGTIEISKGLDGVNRLFKILELSAHALMSDKKIDPNIQRGIPNANFDHGAPLFAKTIAAVALRMYGITGWNGLEAAMHTFKDVEKNTINQIKANDYIIMRGAQFLVSQIIDDVRRSREGE